MSFERRLAEHRAKMHAQDEALRREAWLANWPMRAAAELLQPLIAPQVRACHDG